MNNKNKVAVITGAGSGIGRALAKNLAQLGYDLALADIDETGLAETRRLVLESTTINVLLHKLDVANQQDFMAFSNLVLDEFGGVNILINNAGVALASQLNDTAREDFTWLMNINFWGVVNGTEAFLPILEKSTEAYIVNISSVFGMISVPTQGCYNASKFAVRGYTEALQQELKMDHSSIVACSVHPGGISTKIAENSRVSVSQDKASLVSSFEKIAMTTPEKAAKVIIKGMLKKRNRIMVGPDAHLIQFLYRLLGIRYQAITRYLAKKTALV